MNAKRTLAILLTVVLALGCFAGFTFSSSAESIDLTAQSYITMGKGGDVTDLLTNGNTGDYCDLGYWADAVTDPAFGTEGNCYIQIDLGTVCTVDSVWAVNLGGRNYKWDIYYTDDIADAIGDWTKVDGKTNDDECTAEGYTVTFDSPITAKYIRLYGMYNNANIGYHFCEVKVMGAMVDPNAELEFDGVVKEPTETVSMVVRGSAFGQWENWSERTNALVELDAGANKEYDVMIFEGVKNGTYTVKVTLTDETAEKTYIIPEFHFDAPSKDYYVDGPTYSFFRFAFADYKIPLVVGNAYTIKVEILKGDKVLWEGATEEGGFSNWEKAPTFIENPNAPYDYLEPGEEPPAPALPELSIAPYVYTAAGIKGFENWPAADKQTNLLIRTPKATGDFRNNTWVLTINGEEYTMTVASVGAAGDDYIYRFQVCLADKPFIPVVGTEYTISAEIFDGETLVATTTESAGFIPHEEPIVPTTPEPPVEPEGPVDIEINPYENGDIKGFENWSDQTQLLIRVDGGNEVNYASYTWKITITDGETTKTITMVPSSDSAPWLYRFETCLEEGDNQFIPANGTEYTVSVEILDEEGEVIAKSQERAGFIPFQEPIVPEPDPIDPPVGPGEGDDDKPGQTGDAAVYATIAVAVAAVALAVVFKRRSTI